MQIQQRAQLGTISAILGTTSATYTTTSATSITISVMYTTTSVTQHHILLHHITITAILIMLETVIILQDIQRLVLINGYTPVIGLEIDTAQTLCTQLLPIAICATLFRSPVTHSHNLATRSHNLVTHFHNLATYFHNPVMQIMWSHILIATVKLVTLSMLDLFNPYQER